MMMKAVKHVSWLKSVCASLHKSGGLQKNLWMLFIGVFVVLARVGMDLTLNAILLSSNAVLEGVFVES